MRQNTAESFPMIAALDLGSNSFHMVLARTSNGEMRILERLGEKVQLAAGIDENRLLDEAAMQRGLDCLRRFAQMVNHLPQGAVRIVGTNALREARNRATFIRRAEEIINHQVEVISGREEARLIYLGVSHTVPASQGRRLVADIGGGSTEFIIGEGFESQLRESLQMGCVSYTQRFFRDRRQDHPGALRPGLHGGTRRIDGYRTRPAPAWLAGIHRRVRHHSRRRAGDQERWFRQR